ncbi:hypothetical protein [Brooklawnia cerclae]|uniref:Uncharacterized protein n=1 Tax=Brooklawnia cerclae TaxID=349934 RepID=A0ABX0SE22_9ACTN|nr:hypothetical protein [Brooklawnia cerclae]NIH56630.1 hypothetical protein [Brooklawnia cerclae]
MPKTVMVSRYFGRGRAIDWTDLAPASLDEARQSISLRTAVGSLTLGTGLIHSDPRILFDLIEYYRTHPRDREELADGRVLDRLRRNELPVAPGRLNESAR